MGDRGDAGEEGFGVGGGGAGERFYEDDVGGRGLVAGVEAVDADGHGVWWMIGGVRWLDGRGEFDRSRR